MLYQAELHPENGKPASFAVLVDGSSGGARSVLKRPGGGNGFRQADFPSRRGESRREALVSLPDKEVVCLKEPQIQACRMG